jgi:hypothetical protein
VIARVRARALHAAAVLAIALAAPACTPGCKPPPQEGDDDVVADAMPTGPDAYTGPTFQECGAAAPAFVREASLALLGHRPSSQREVDAYVALYQQADAARTAGKTTADPRAVVARVMLARPEKIERWTQHFMDALRVTRIGVQSQASCWGKAKLPTIDGALARFVRDSSATASAPSAFTMLDLAHSAIAANDPTPIYRAHLFALVSAPIPAANVGKVEAELARREDYGNAFDAAYLNRDIVCLGCHNSEFSVTDAPDPKIDRHWPLAGHVDQAVFGMSNGEDTTRAHAAFRFDGFADEQFGGVAAFGLDAACGRFAAPASIPADPAGIDGRFATLVGQKLTVFDLDAALKRGLDALRGKSLAVAADGTVADADAAFAYMVATQVVEGVWREVVGTRLTIANYFPRNQASRDLLQHLTDHFVQSGYSLDDLLVDIVTSDYFARKAPEEACGIGPYNYPDVYDPWVIADTDAARRGNGPGDAVAPVSVRTLLAAAYAGLEWLPASDEQFPQEQSASQAPEDQLGFLRSVGAYLKSGERGFRGLDFQARLGWEDRFGACRKPARVTGKDLVDRALDAGRAAPGATVGDVVALIKDRLVGEPVIDETAGAGGTSERAAVEAMVGVPLTAPAAMLTDAAARRVCGVLLSSPQFVLQGLAGRGGPAPKLTLPGDGFDDACARIRDAKVAGWMITCAPGTLTATPGA